MINAVALMVAGVVLIVLGVLGRRGRLPRRWRIRARPMSLVVDTRAAGPLVAVGGGIGLLGGGLFALTPESDWDWILVGGPGMLALFAAGVIRGAYASHKADHGTT